MVTTRDENGRYRMTSIYGVVRDENGTPIQEGHTELAKRSRQKRQR